MSIYRTVRMIEVDDWDNLVEKTYGKPYSLQQQDGCMYRGIIDLEIPNNECWFENHEIPEIVNGDERGVSLFAWLARDPSKPLTFTNFFNGGESIEDSKFIIDLWWHRNFYPALDEIATDLYEKGLIEKGEYKINIDW